MPDWVSAQGLHFLFLTTHADVTAKCTSRFSLNADKSACICRPGKVLSPDGTLCVARCVTGWYDFGNGSCATCPEPFFACTDAVTPTRWCVPSRLEGVMPL